MSQFDRGDDAPLQNNVFEAKLKMIAAVANDQKVSDKNFREAVKSLLQETKPTLSTQWDR